jgi:hypothetical protein
MSPAMTQAAFWVGLRKPRSRFALGLADLSPGKREPHMRLRLLQIGLVAADGLFGLILIVRYGSTILAHQRWPFEQQVALLVAGFVLPLAVASLRYPLAAGIGQFATAFIGNQLLHDAPLPALRLCSVISMVLALAMLVAAVFRGIFEITQEAFGQAEDQDEKRAAGAA